ncbi:MAG: hypothetical protein WD534_00950 [Phycisphaeraceae bacterium]
MVNTRAGLGSFLVWFAMFGGAVAWLVHFLGIYLLGEFGCHTTLRDVTFLRLTGVAWSILAVTVLMFALAVAALLAAHHNQRLIADQLPDARDNLRFAAHLGRISNTLFAGVILFQTLPVLFYLGGC